MFQKNCYERTRKGFEIIFEDIPYGFVIEIRQNNRGINCTNDFGKDEPNVLFSQNEPNSLYHKCALM